MGRQRYLTRLALGRSAFEEPEIEESLDITPSRPPERDEGQQQQYDAKGRPINPRTEACNAAMRKAQNDVLALVGVVERKHLADQMDQQRSKLWREARQGLLAHEQDLGEILELITFPLDMISHMWLDAVMQRIQIGLYDVRAPMAAILQSEWRAMRRGSLKGFMAHIAPGMGDTVAYFLVKVPFMLGLRQVAGRVQNYLGQTRLGRQSRKEVFLAISFLVEALVVALDIALLPMDFYTAAQRLGVVPLLPLFPPLSFFLPWHPDSFHRAGWRPSTLGVGVFRTLTSPVALLLIDKLVSRDADDDEAALFGVFSPFRFPTLDDDPAGQPPVSLLRDPIGRLLHSLWALRTHILHRLGWNLVKIEPRPAPETELENNTLLRPPQSSSSSAAAPRDGGGSSSSSSRAISTVQRSTALSHLPAQFLAAAVDSWLARALTLPFDSVLSRAIAATCMTAFPSVPKTAAAWVAAPTLYRPFGGGPFGRLRVGDSDALRDAAMYANKLGLSFALHVAIDVVLFAGVYGATRYVGMRYLQWGQTERDEEHLEGKRPS